MMRKRWKEERNNTTTNSNAASCTGTIKEEDGEGIISENDYFIRNEELKDLLESTSDNKQ